MKTTTPGLEVVDLPRVVLEGVADAEVVVVEDRVGHEVVGAAVGLALHDRSKGMRNVGRRALDVAALQAQAVFEDLRHRVLAQHAHQIAGPGPIVEEDVAVEPGNVAATAGQPGSGQVEQTLLLPEQRTGADPE